MYPARDISRTAQDRDRARAQLVCMFILADLVTSVVYLRRPWDLVQPGRTVTRSKRPYPTIVRLTVAPKRTQRRQSAAGIYSS